MFQPPALIVMTIGATRMHRSLIEFYELGYSTSYLLYSVFMLTVTNVSLFSIPFSLEGGARRTQHPTYASQRQFRSTGWR